MFENRYSHLTCRTEFTRLKVITFLPGVCTCVYCCVCKCIAFFPVAVAIQLGLHDDVNKWNHFPRYWTGHLYGEFTGPRSPVNSLHKGQWRGAFMFSLICTWIKRWVNNLDVGDLRRYRAHYDVIVMYPLIGWTFYRKISWTRPLDSDIEFFQSVWNLTSTSAAALPSCLLNCREIRSL